MNLLVYAAGVDELILFLVEFLFEFVVELLIDASERAVAPKHSYRLRMRKVTVIAFGLSGLAIGFISAAIAPHPVLLHRKFYGTSVLVAPFATGFAMSRIGRYLTRRGYAPAELERFWNAFALAFGIAAARYLFTV